MSKIFSLYSINHKYIFNCVQWPIRVAPASRCNWTMQNSLGYCFTVCVMLYICTTIIEATYVHV